MLDLKGKPKLLTYALSQTAGGPKTVTIPGMGGLRGAAGATSSALQSQGRTVRTLFCLSPGIDPVISYVSSVSSALTLRQKVYPIPETSVTE